MKTTILFSILLNIIVISVFSQVPEAFSYQAVVRNSAGDVVSNQDVSFRISILQNTDAGPAVYVETHTYTTNSFGLANLKIGKGTLISGAFNPGGWGAAPHFIKIEIDPLGGNSFEELGTSQLLSVPYAFHAKTVETDQVNDADADPENELQSISLSGTQLTLSDGGGTVTLPSSGGGDNWGTQTVVSNGTLSGNGTTASPLAVVGDLTDNQTLSVSGNDLTISDGNTVTLPAGSASPWGIDDSNIFYNTGKVTIGADAPSPNGLLSIFGKSSNGWISFNNNATGNLASDGMVIGPLNDGSKFYFWNLENSPLVFATNNNERLRIDKDGNVGIGTNTPVTKLHISDGGIWMDNNPHGIRMESSTFYNSVVNDAGNLHISNYGYGDILLRTSTIIGMAGASLVVKSNGNIGLGTQNPGAGLHLKGTSFPSSFMYIEANAGQDAGFRLYEATTAKWHIFNNAAAGGLQIYNTAAQTAIFAKQSNAFIGIGTTNPTQALHVVGNAYKTEGGTSWATSSDIRLKNVLGTYSKGLEKIISLQPVRYIYKKDNPRQLNSTEVQVGFVAQEVQKIFPEAVTTGEDGYLDFNIHSINVAMVNAIKELNNENQQLKNKVEDLEKRLQKMESYFELSASKK